MIVSFDISTMLPRTSLSLNSIFADARLQSDHAQCRDGESDKRDSPLDPGQIRERTRDLGFEKTLVDLEHLDERLVEALKGQPRLPRRHPHAERERLGSATGALKVADLLVNFQVLHEGVQHLHRGFALAGIGDVVELDANEALDIVEASAGGLRDRLCRWQAGEQLRGLAEESLLAPCL